MRKFMFAAVSAMVLVCVSNVFANQSAMQLEANNGIQSDSVVTDTTKQEVAETPVEQQATATETPADSASATTETVEAPADSAVAQ